MVTLESIQGQLARIELQLNKPERLSVSVIDAAEMLGVSKSTLYRLLEEREISYSLVAGETGCEGAEYRKVPTVEGGHS